jgi:hypothetical protein
VSSSKTAVDYRGESSEEAFSSGSKTKEAPRPNKKM